MPRPAPEGQHIATRRIGLCRRLRARCSASPARRSRPHVALVDGCACDASRGRRVRLPALACAARAAAGRLCKAKGAARCSLSVAALGGAYLPCCVGLVAPTALEAHRGCARSAGSVTAASKEGSAAVRCALLTAQLGSSVAPRVRHSQQASTQPVRESVEMSAEPRLKRNVPLRVPRSCLVSIHFTSTFGGALASRFAAQVRGPARKIPPGRVLCQ